MTQAIILVGGLGTRLKTLYPDRPKALVPISGQPFIERQIEVEDSSPQDGHLASTVSFTDMIAPG